jgi:hypothetical protein
MMGDGRLLRFSVCMSKRTLSVYFILGTQAMEDEGNMLEGTRWDWKEPIRLTSTVYSDRGRNKEESGGTDSTNSMRMRIQQVMARANLLSPFFRSLAKQHSRPNNAPCDRPCPGANEKLYCTPVSRYYTSVVYTTLFACSPNIQLSPPHRVQVNTKVQPKFYFSPGTSQGLDPRLLGWPVIVRTV